MGEIVDFPRFREPDHTDDPKVKGMCESCGGDLYEGDEILYLDGDLYCDDECLLNHLAPSIILL
jgi:hypothetical protein